MLILQLINFSAFGQLSVIDLKTEHQTNPIGIGATHPRFTWEIRSDDRNTMQTAYQMRILLDKQMVWNPGKISSDQSVHISYEGKALQSGKKYSWQVRVWDNHGNRSAWSEPAFFQMGLLNKNDWKAQWIEPGFQEDARRPSPLLRKQFASNKKIVSATAYITAHGLYEAYINGHRVGDAYFTPGWTSYHLRLQYQAYDVTHLLNKGQNAVGVILGNGWYRGMLAWEDNKGIYGKDVAILFQLKITYADGTVASIISDESWKSSTGAIRYAEIYHGETIDARMEKTGWLLPGYVDDDWSAVKVVDFGFDNIIATVNEPVRKQETFQPVKIFTTPKGEKVIDFGQNLVGWVMLKVRGHAGDTVTISHAEVLDKHGNFYTDNLRVARAQDHYILKGGGVETFEPHFTWHGFRYIKIEGYPGEIVPENFTAVALYSDMEQAGTFTSSHPLVNQLQHNIIWGQKGNFIDIPTDCPQRDERLGWTGDAQVFSRTASLNMNVNNFFAKWMKDVAADQLPNGSVPHVVPNVLGPDATGSTGWGDAATIIPWNMYLVYGDKRILKEQYASMKAWVEYMRSKSKDDLWNTGFHFGDWLFYSPDDDNVGRAAVTDKYLIAQCFYAHSTQLLIKAAKVLHKKQDAATYTALLQRIKDAFLKEYMTPNGHLVSGTQTAYVLALHFDMMPERLRNQAAKRLVQNIERYDNHLTTGFLGTPYLCEVLSRFGYDSVAYKLLLQETYPSWLYPVTMGATTIWERWDGIKPDGTFQTPTMNSFNHYAYGAIGEWMYRMIAGLDTYEDGVGYRHIRIKPHIGGGLTHVSASVETYYGSVSNSWKVEKNRLIMDVQIPTNTKATVFIPAANVNAVRESGQVLSTIDDINFTGVAGDYVVVQLGSGLYHFTVSNFQL